MRRPTLSIALPEQILYPAAKLTSDFNASAGRAARPAIPDVLSFVYSLVGPRLECGDVWHSILNTTDPPGVLNPVCDS